MPLVRPCDEPVGQRVPGRPGQVLELDHAVLLPRFPDQPCAARRGVPHPDAHRAPPAAAHAADRRDDQAGAHSQVFARGTLVEAGPTVPFMPWPQQFGGWKAEYSPGHATVYGPPSLGLPGQPALVRDVPSPNFAWTASPTTAQRM